MNVVVRFTLACMLVVTASRTSAQSSSWSEPYAPFKVAGNLYYVGSRGLASYLVATPQGHILINPSLVTSPALIKASIEQLGFKYNDIRVILISHAHWDHNAGAAAMKAATGAKYMVMDADVATVESGGKADFHYGADTGTRFPIAKIDRVLHDGDTVTLGDATLVAHLTPGHTKGCTTWTLKVVEAGKSYDVVIVGSPNVNAGFKLVNNATYPHIASDYERMFRKLKSLPVDIFLGAHGSYFGMESKVAQMGARGFTVFVDPTGYQSYVAEREKAFRDERAKQDPFAAARDTIRQILEAQRIPSAVVAVAKGNRILWEEAFGYADLDNKIPATIETMYSLASISKPFTATGMMILVDRKTVDLDRPANDYLGAAKLRSFEGDASAMTVRRIMSHSAGLPLHYQFFYDGGVPRHSNDEAITKYGFAGYPPGTAYFYSNLGFGIIDYILERRSRRSYEDFMRREVFEPLDLRHTTVSTGKDLGTRAAVRYSPDLKPHLPYAFDHTGASGVWSSAHDLVRFGMFHVGAQLPKQKAIISSESRAAMQRNEAPEQGPGSSYGLGWGTLADDNGYRRVSHTGGMPGVSTALNLYPSDSVVIVVMINRDNIGGAVGRIATAMASAVLPRYASTREERRAAQGGRGAAFPPQVTQLSILPLPAPTGLWRGFAIVGRDSIPVTLDYASAGAPRMQIGRDSARTVTFSSANGWYSGNVRVPLRAPDAAPSTEAARTVAALSLRMYGNSMRGWVSSISQGPPAYGAVSYRLDLRKQ